MYKNLEQKQEEMRKRLKTTRRYRKPIVRAPLTLEQRMKLREAGIARRIRMDMDLHQQLLEAAKSVGFNDKTPGETDDEYLTRLVRTVATVDDPAWNIITKAGQAWFNDAVDAVNAMQSPPALPGFNTAEVEQPNPEAEPPAEPESKVALPLPATEPQKPMGSLPTTKPTIPAIKQAKRTRVTSGLIDALRRTVIQHPDWSARTVYDHLTKNGFPNANIETVNVNVSDLHKVIAIARELRFWNDAAYQTTQEQEVAS